ncbi:MAG: GDP-mannose 4,6-dehydratase [Microgenomates group bacterium Gr01-1014_7]|nr:MAG: GDP-mannose 4,6-dehydratase [Microgenomates group bacterium Gr01-1014_7]
MAKSKRAFITGISGQDGSYLSELLLNKGYEVGGLIRRNAIGELGNIEHIKDDIKIYFGDLQSPESIALALLDFKPDEIYNLASLSSPFASFSDKFASIMITGVGALHVFERAKQIVPEAKVYQASTSEMFGVPKQVPQNEATPFSPANPYAAAKEFAHRMAVIGRLDRKQPQFISCGILFNHESPRRGLNFVTRKITAGVACIKNNKKEGIPLNEIGEPIVQNGKIKLGDLNAERDWGYSPDYVEAMWKILQQRQANDFVIATGEIHTVEDFVREAFATVGLDWKEYVVTDSNFVPPVQTGPLQGDASYAKKVLDWEPKTKFKDLVKIMVHYDLAKFS